MPIAERCQRRLDSATLSRLSDIIFKLEIRTCNAVEDQMLRVLAITLGLALTALAMSVPPVSACPVGTFRCAGGCCR
jgi:hypothetical protein